MTEMASDDPPSARSAEHPADRQRVRPPWRRNPFFVLPALGFPAVIVAGVGFALEFGRGDGFWIWLVTLGGYIVLYVAAVITALLAGGSPSEEPAP